MTDLLAANRRRATTMVVLAVVVSALVGTLLGWLLGHLVIGLVVGALVGVLAIVLTFRYSVGWLRRVSRSRPADPTEFARLHNLVDGLSLASGLPKPALFVIDDPAPNALTFGCSTASASMIFTTGMLELLDRVELEGVVAHELSHVRNGDIVPSTLAAVLVAWPSLVADLLIRRRWWNGGRVPRTGDPDETKNPLSVLGFGMLAFAPLTSRSLRAFVPAERESNADLSAVQLTRYPPGLITALEKVSGDVAVSHAVTTATAHAWLEQPLSGVGDDGKLPRVHAWFNTHPPLAERIELLREL